MMNHIRFQDEEYVLVGDTEGAIAKPEDYQHGRMGFAHLMSDGRIMRLGTEIGTIADIEWLGVMTDLEPAEDAFLNLFSWFVNFE